MAMTTEAAATGPPLEHDARAAARALVQAAALLREAIDRLDARAEPCEACGHRRPSDAVESDAHRQLLAAERKARYWAAVLPSPSSRAAYLKEQAERQRKEAELAVPAWRRGGEAE